MLEMSHEEFESMVADGLDSLSDDMMEKLDNVIGYILEQIYEKVSSVVKVLNDIFNAVID